MNKQQNLAEAMSMVRRENKSRKKEEDAEREVEREKTLVQWIDGRERRREELASLVVECVMDAQQVPKKQDEQEVAQQLGQKRCSLLAIRLVSMSH